MASDRPGAAREAAGTETDSSSPVGFPTGQELARTHPPVPFERIWKNPEELCEAEHAALVRHVGYLLPAYELPSHLAEDVVQDAWVALIRQWDSVDRPLPWMYAVVRNQVHARAEAAARRRRILGTAAAQAALCPPASVETEMDTLVELHDVLRALPQKECAAVLLSVLGDKKGQEVAEIMGISENTVGVHTHRARKKLRGMLEGIGTFMLIVAAILNIPVPVRQPHDSGLSGRHGGEQDTASSSASERTTAAPDDETETMAALRAKAAQYDEGMKKPNLSNSAMAAFEASPERFVDTALVRMSEQERAAMLAEFHEAAAERRVT